MAPITEGITDDEGVLVPWKLCPPDRLVAEIIRLRAERDAWCREAGRLERENALLRAGAPLPLPAPTTISASTARGCATKVLDASRQPDPAPGGTENG